MKTLYPIGIFLALSGIACAQSVLPKPRVERPRTTGATSTALYLTSTIAGMGGFSGYVGDGGPAVAAQMANPIAVAVDSHGNYFISDYHNNVIREVVAATGNIMTVAGTGTPGFSGDGGLATAAQFSAAHSIAVDNAGNLYIADSPNGRIRKVDTLGNMSTFAGNGTYGDTGDGGLAVNASLFFPAGVAVDNAGNVYIADYGNSTVREVSAATGIINTIAGIDARGFAGFPGEGGPANQALLGLPYSVTVDESGNVFFLDIGSSSIRKVGKNGILTTVVPNVSTSGIATDPAGNLYYADYRAHVINKVQLDGTVVPIGGVSGSAGYSGDNSPGTVAHFNAPYGVAVDSSAKVYVADYNNDVVRLLTPVAAPNLVVVNGANEVPGPISPGEVVSIFGNNIGFVELVVNQPDASGLYETSFANTMVSFNGIPAPILVSGPTYVSAVVPYGVGTATQANIVVTNLGQTTGTATVPVAPSAPGIFTSSSTGIWGGGLAVQNADGSANSPSNPAAESSTITVFMTGEGVTVPPGTDGLVTSASNPPVPILPVAVNVGTGPATTLTWNEAPGQVAGVLQVNVTLPASVTTSNTVALQAVIGNAATQIITIAVK
jgi:uncharacterized protein (TIGR03437 family)